jgi:hypothetical protein
MGNIVEKFMDYVKKLSTNFTIDIEHVTKIEITMKKMLEY